MLRAAFLPTAALWFALALAACDRAAQTSEAALLPPSPIRLAETAPPSPTTAPTATPVPSPTPSPTAKTALTATPSPIAKPAPSPTPSPIAKPAPSPTPSPTAKPAPSPTPSASATAKPAPSPTPSATATPVPTSLAPSPSLPTASAGSSALIVLDGGETSPTVSVGGAAFGVEIAFTPEDRARGLSGRDSLADGSGMLFVFESGQASSFWMRGMRFDLDFVWIGDGCEVVDIHARVPAPPSGAGVGGLPTYSSQPPARYNLEINAGEAARRGIEIGDRVKFSGFSGEGATCE